MTMRITNTEINSQNKMDLPLHDQPYEVIGRMKLRFDGQKNTGDGSLCSTENRPLCSLYDNEPATVELMHQFMFEQGYVLDITDSRYHHEIYLSDARKTTPDKLKTVIRHPIKAV